MKKVFTSLALAVSLALTPLFAAEPTFIDKAKQAVALLYSQDESGGMKMRCTVTAFEKAEKGYLFVTAAHCVGSDDTTKEKSASPFKTSFFITFDEKGSEKRFYPAAPKFVGYQSRGEDFSVFSVDTKETWETVEIGDEKVLKDGAQYWNIASPLGLGKQTFEGIISSVFLDRPLVEGDINWAGTLVLQQAGVNGGSSGSALISKETHKIVGFLVGSVAGSTIIAIPVSRFVAVRKAVDAKKYKWWTLQEDVNPDGTPKQ
jgi:S1-C subfamily serine protease